MSVIQKGNQIFVEEKITIDTLCISLKELPNWNDLIATASKAYSNAIVFTK